jgi:hypothetical protein
MTAQQIPLRVAIATIGVLAATAAAPLASLASPPERSAWDTARDWFGEHFEVHGFLRTNFYVRTPNFGETPVPSSLRSEINLEPELRLYESDEWNVSFYGVFRPVYEAVFDTQSDLYGRGPEQSVFGTGAAFPNNRNARLSGKGKSFPQDGGRLAGEFTMLNADTGSLFSPRRIASIAIDDVVFFGRVTAPTATKGPNQAQIGGPARGTTYEQLRDNFGLLLFPGASPGIGNNPLANGGLPAGLGLDASLALASQPLTTPLSFYGRQSSRNSLDQGSADINATEDELKYDCFDIAHPYCVAREFYLEIERGDTFVRVGRQQIVWGKTDAFRLQDTINPIDFSYHNVFPSLEDRRIPVLALDAIQSLGTVGPFDDVSFEVAWVWDRFIPDQFGQCGEAWTFTAGCEARADAGGHALFNFSLAGVQEREWTFGNTQPGARVEFRLPDPSIAFSLSFFYGSQKTPVAEFGNFYSVDNPNAAVMLFLQGLFDPAVGNVASAIDGLAQLGAANGGPFPYSGGVWLSGFDPYDRNGPTPTPGGTLEAANQDLQNAWFSLANLVPPGGGGCAGVPDGPALQSCGAQIAIFGLPWSASQAVLKYPRIWSLGASMDYQIPGIDTILRLEVASDLNRGIQNTNLLDQVDESDVFKAAVGLDRSTFIPFINPDRTAFISLQTFVEHIVDYDGDRFGDDGMVPWETTVISTLFTQNYWRNDSLILTNLVAADWKSSAYIWGPSFKWVYDDHLSFEFGVNLLWGDSQKHNLRDLCADGTLSCFGNPATWQQGNWQTLNGPLVRAAQAPFWGQQSFADKFMRNRDEFWVGVTWQW